MTALDRLARYWWMIAVRGGLAGAFGVALLAWPGMTLSIVVLLFAAYTILDGGWAIASAMVADRSIGRLAVAVEGLVSLALGTLALVWPWVSRDFIQLVAGWGVLTGVLEIVAAASLPREQAGHWLLGTAGVCSLFLALLVQMVPVADVARVVDLIGAYALSFGLILTCAARWFRGAHRRPTLVRAIHRQAA